MCLSKTQFLFFEIKFEISDVFEFSIGNFRGFRVPDFGLHTKIENSENSEIVSRLVNLTDYFCLFEETGKFRDFSFFQPLH